MAVLYIIIAVLALALALTLILLRRKTAQVRRMTKLYEAGKKIASNIKIKRLMREIMETVKAETGAEACSLYMVDEEKNELWFEVALGEKGDLIKEIRLKIDESTVAGYVAKRGETLNFEDVNKDLRFAKRDIAKKIGFSEKAMLTMPVRFKDRTIGVLQLINKSGGGVFGRQDEELLDGMSSQIAIALENARLYKLMNEMFVDMIRALANAIDAKDPYTNGHSKRVTEYAMMTAKDMGLSEDQLERLEYTAVLHDVGKIGIRDEILNKQAKLDDEEFTIMKTHTIIGARILEEMKTLHELSNGARYHHEKFDGTGYHEKLRQEDIPLEARIIAVADTYDAMTTDRPYRKGLAHEVAVGELQRFSGTQFDPDIVEHFIAAVGGKLDADA